VLLKKFFNVGFEEIRVAERRPFGLEDLRRYPLFAPEFIEFLQRVIPPDRKSELVFAIVVTARRPQSIAVGRSHSSNLAEIDQTKGDKQ
jgi:hypothetical protein